MTAPRTLGIIGGSGWLGRSIGNAALSARLIVPGSLFLSNRSGPAGFVAWPDVWWTHDNQAVVERSDVVILSVRPEQFPAVEIDAHAKLVISVMAAVSTQTLRKRTGSTRIVRAMPNAAAEIGCSYTPWHASEDVSAAEKRFVRALFETCGTEDELPAEEDIDYLTGLTGSGPAFPALLAKAMLSHALSKGLPHAIARRAVQGVVAGASQLVTSSGASPDELIQTFLGYRGTTAAGLQAMIANGFDAAVHAGLDAAETAVAKMADSAGKQL